VCVCVCVCLMGWGGGSGIGSCYGVKYKTVKLLFVVVLRTPMERRHIVICTTENLKMGRQRAAKRFRCCCIITGESAEARFRGVMC
jgi:hypothetical protein